MTPRISRVGEFTLPWGESLCWDDRRGRLYFVDCGNQVLHWLEEAEPPLRSLPMPSLPTGVALCEGGELVVALDDGLHVVDPDAGRVEILSPYPSELGGRANDVAADLDGNLVTGTLSVVPSTSGSYWWYSSEHGWRLLDTGIGNANGPAVIYAEGRPTLVFADTPASVLYAYPYDGAAGTVGERRTFADTRAIGGMPDGACADADDGVWSCILEVGKIARYTAGGLDEVFDTGVAYPSDVTFGGDALDRMFFVSIAIPIEGIEATPPAGALMAVEGIGRRGRVEPRFRL